MHMLLSLLHDTNIIEPLTHLEILFASICHIRYQQFYQSWQLAKIAIPALDTPSNFSLIAATGI